MKKLLQIICIILISLASFSTSFASALGDDNILSNAYALRRATLLELVGGSKIENEINSLRTELGKLELRNEINAETKEKLLNDLALLEEQIISLNKELIENIENTDEFDELLVKYNEEIELKKELVEELNNSIKENELNYEKIDLLIEKYVQEKEKIDDTASKQIIIKGLIFAIVSLVTVFIYGLSTYLSRQKKLSTKRYVYINFFLAFAYIIFLIAYFFYLYPQFSVFLIFMSGYMLVINSHLIGSFIGSLIVLQRFKIGEIIRSGNTYGRISNITPLYIVLSPLTDDGVYDSKSIYIPHVNILKDTISLDKIPDLIIHTFKITIKEDSGVDIMKFLNEVESNILQKFLHNKLRSLAGSNDFYRISFEFTNVGHNVIIFKWKADALLNNKVERKIVGLLSKTIAEAKKQKEKDKEEEIINDENIVGAINPKEEEVK